MEHPVGQPEPEQTRRQPESEPEPESEGAVASEAAETDALTAAAAADAAAAAEAEAVAAAAEAAEEAKALAEAAAVAAEADRAEALAASAAVAGTVATSRSGLRQYPDAVAPQFVVPQQPGVSFSHMSSAPGLPPSGFLPPTDEQQPQLERSSSKIEVVAARTYRVWAVVGVIMLGFMIWLFIWSTI